MSDHPAPADTAETVDTAEPGGRSTPFGRGVLDLWHRIRSGEDPIAFAAVVVVVALVAGLAWFSAGARHGGVPAASAAPNASADGFTAPGTTAIGSQPPTTGPPLAVHVAGAVSRPGLYHLPSGSRVDDALRAAGGKRPRADLDRLNLAAKLVDGQKIHVSRHGEPAPPATVGPVAGDGTALGPGTGLPGPNGAPEPIDLNAADLAVLDSLPGIGPATARAILEERHRRGGFRSTRDLLRVPGIGEGRFARLKDRVRV